MSFCDYLLLFSTSLLAVFLLGVQSRNVNQGRYTAAIVTSFGISTANFMFVKYASTGTFSAFLTAAVGGCIGIAIAIWFSQTFIEKTPKPIPRTGDWEPTCQDLIDSIAKPKRK